MKIFEVRRKTKMMGIQSKVKGKINIFLFLFICLFSLSACLNTKKKLVEDSFRSIEAGLTTDEVRTQLGEPKRIVTKFEEIQELRDEDAEKSIDRWETENPKIYNKFYGSEDNEQTVYQILKDRKDIICYVYQYEEDISQEIGYWHIYFIDDEVVTMYFP